MYEKELSNIMNQILDILNTDLTTPNDTFLKLQNLEKEIENQIPEKNTSYYQAISKVKEAIGDIWVRCKRAADAEKAYREMMLNAQKCYEADHQNDLVLGHSAYKIASFYRLAIQCANFSNVPKQLNENQQKIFNISEVSYKNAISCTLENAKKGDSACVELHATCMNELSVLYAAIGDYPSAIQAGKDGISLDRIIYKKINDKARCFLYANRLNSLANIYMITKDVLNAANCLGLSIQVLKEHKDEEPITYGILLGKNYITLGTCYFKLHKDEALIESTYLTGLDYMENVNVKINNRLDYDVIKCTMIIGDYYHQMNKAENAKKYYELAFNQAQETFAKTKDCKFDAIVKQLQPLIKE